MSTVNALYFGLWVAMTVGFILVEVHTLAFYALFVAIGAATAAVADLLGADLWLQGILFVAVCVTGWALVRPLLRSRFDRTTPVAKFLGIQGSADGLVGQRAITLDTVGDEHHPGHLLFAGDRWLAVSESDPLPAQVPVVVVAVRGTTLLVRRAQPA